MRNLTILLFFFSFTILQEQHITPRIDAAAFEKEAVKQAYQTAKKLLAKNQKRIPFSTTLFEK